MRQQSAFLIVDVFTDVPLAGNQLAVFTNATGISESRMQELAREMGFSETVFVLPPEQGGHIRARIFTPETELPFAGHPVLGTAFAVAAPLQLTLAKIETGMGIVPVMLEREGARLVFGRMQQPLPVVEPFAEGAELLAALGLSGSKLPIETYDNGVRHTYVVVETFAEVAGVVADFGKLAELGAGGFSVSAHDGSRAKTRCFVPGLGGPPEDPATGSAAGPLAVHFARHGLMAWGSELEISQGAEIRRPSTLVARVEGQGDTPTLVEVGGSAVVVARGEFSVTPG